MTPPTFSSDDAKTLWIVSLGRGTAHTFRGYSQSGSVEVIVL